MQCCRLFPAADWSMRTSHGRFPISFGELESLGEERCDLSRDEVAIFRADFALFDSSGTGTLCREDVQAMLHKELDQEPSEEVLRDFWAAAEANADGRIRFEEYLDVVLGRGWSVEGEPGVPWPCFRIEATQS